MIILTLFNEEIIIHWLCNLLIQSYNWEKRNVWWWYKLQLMIYKRIDNGTQEINYDTRFDEGHRRWVNTCIYNEVINVNKKTIIFI